MSYRDKVIETESRATYRLPPRHQPLHIQCEDGVVLHVSDDYVLETGGIRNAVIGWHLDAGQTPLVAHQDEHGVVSFSLQPKDEDDALHNYLIRAKRESDAASLNWIVTANSARRAVDLWLSFLIENGCLEAGEAQMQPIIGVSLMPPVLAEERVWQWEEMDLPRSEYEPEPNEQTPEADKEG